MSFNQLLLQYCFYLVTVFSFTVTLPAFSEDCYYEKLEVHDVLLISYDIISGGDQLIDFKLFGPTGVNLQDTPNKKDAYYHYNATDVGNHKFCFTNGPDNKSLSFHTNVIKKNVQEKQGKVDNSEKVDEEFMELERLVSQINTARSAAISRSFYINKSNSAISKRIFWWGVFQIVTLIGVCGWQTYYIKKFFEVKRFV